MQETTSSIVKTKRKMVNKPANQYIRGLWYGRPEMLLELNLFGELAGLPL